MNVLRADVERKLDPERSGGPARRAERWRRVRSPMHDDLVQPCVNEDIVA